MLGQLIEGQRALDRYTHDHAHDVGNLSGKVDGLSHSIRKQFEELESRINRRIEDTAMQLRADTVSLRVELGAANVKIATLEASSHVTCKLTNTPATLPGNHVRLIPKVAGDRIMGSIAIASVSVTGNTVAVATVQPHGLNTADFVTVGGFTPISYNVNGAAIASVMTRTRLLTLRAQPRRPGPSSAATTGRCGLVRYGPVAASRAARSLGTELAPPP